MTRRRPPDEAQPATDTHPPATEPRGPEKSFYGLSRTAAIRLLLGTIEKATEPSHPQDERRRCSEAEERYGIPGQDDRLRQPHEHHPRWSERVSWRRPGHELWKPDS